MAHEELTNEQMRALIYTPQESAALGFGSIIAAAQSNGYEVPQSALDTHAELVAAAKAERKQTIPKLKHLSEVYSDEVYDTAMNELELRIAEACAKVTAGTGLESDDGAVFSAGMIGMYHRLRCWHITFLELLDAGGNVQGAAWVRDNLAEIDRRCPWPVVTEADSAMASLTDEDFGDLE